MAVGWWMLGSLVVCLHGVMGRSTFGWWFGTLGDGTWRGELGERQEALDLVKRCRVPLAWECWGGLGLARCLSVVPPSPVQGVGIIEGEWGVGQGGAFGGCRGVAVVGVIEVE